MGLYERIKDIASEKGYSINRLEKELGFPRSSIRKYNTNVPGIDKIRRIAEHLDVSPADIMGMPKTTIKTFNPEEVRQMMGIDNDDTDDDENVHTSGVNLGNIALGSRIKQIEKEVSDYSLSSGIVSFKIPVLGRVVAGLPIGAVQEMIGFINIDEDMILEGEHFGLIIRGDSMEPRMRNGDIVVVRKQDDADSEDIVVVLVNSDDAVCKRLKKYPDGSIALMSINPAYEPMFFTAEEVKNLPVNIIGKVREIRSKL